MATANGLPRETQCAGDENSMVRKPGVLIVPEPFAVKTPGVLSAFTPPTYTA